MRHIFLIAALFLFSCPAFAEDIVERYLDLNVQYLEDISEGKYESALGAAIELSEIDPSDTRALLYIVFASIKAGKPIPEWVMNEPWPDATGEDRFNRRLAEKLASGT